MEAWLPNSYLLCTDSQILLYSLSALHCMPYMQKTERNVTMQCALVYLSYLNHLFRLSWGQMFVFIQVFSWVTCKDLSFVLKKPWVKKKNNKKAWTSITCIPLKFSYISGWVVIWQVYTAGPCRVLKAAATLWLLCQSSGCVRPE